MLTKHTKSLSYIASAFLIVVFAVLAGLFVLIESAKEKLGARQVEIAEVKLHEQEFSAVARLVEESKSERERLSKYILQEEDIIDFLALLGTLGDEQGVVLEIQSLNVENVDGLFEELFVDVSVSGTSGAVLHMLTLLETLPYQSFVEKTEMKKESQESNENSGLWNGTFLLRVTKHKES